MMNEPSVFVPGRLSARNVERLRATFRFLFHLFADVQVRELAPLPEGGCILCANHLSRFDAPLVFCLLRGRAVTAFAADTYRSNPFFRTVVECVDTIWVHRGAIGPSTLKAALQALRQGRVLGVAPEGTRSPTRALQVGRTGAAALASAANVPIVPIAITNTENLGASLLRPWRGRLPITLTFGVPFRLPDSVSGTRADKLEAYTTEIMCRIAALLPSQYHGAYAGHPRLLELLNAQAEAR